MPRIWRPGRHALLAAFAAGLCSSHAAALPLINEILLNPPGTDSPNEYIELRGTPLSRVAAGTYLLGIEGDEGGNPGDVQNIFNLSGRSFGSNGFLVLLQKNSLYGVDSGAGVLTNAGSDPGWGSGAGSSISHMGDDGTTDLENASVSFMLIRSDVAPTLASDIDTNDDGTPDGVYNLWTILDSVGVLDSSDAGDFAYGLINFRSGNGEGEGRGTVVDVDFTASYLGRLGNSIGSGENDWIAGDNLCGTAPNWQLDDQDVSNPELTCTWLDHPGSRNTVPEPGSLAMAGAAGLLLVRRRSH